MQFPALRRQVQTKCSCKSYWPGKAQPNVLRHRGRMRVNLQTILTPESCKQCSDGCNHRRVLVRSSNVNPRESELLASSTKTAVGWLKTNLLHEPWGAWSRAENLVIQGGPRRPPTAVNRSAGLRWSRTLPHAGHVSILGGLSTTVSWPLLACLCAKQRASGRQCAVVQLECLSPG
jgi:hypothetical protein